MKFNIDRHHRKSIRLKNYDYSSEWLYFITISVNNKLCLFWEIENKKNNIFESWKMIEKYWLDLEKEYSNIKLYDYVIMPNHFHWIIEIKNKNQKCDCKICRDTPCGYPDWQIYFPNTNQYSYNMQKNYFLLDDKDINKPWISIKDTHKGCPYNRYTISNIIWWFKSKTTDEYIKWVYNKKYKVFDKRLWQKGFYENIIRDEKWYIKIRDYIINNPYNWQEDRFYYTEI